MEDKIKILLDKLNIDKDFYQYFNDAIISKVLVTPDNKNWNIYIYNKDMFDISIIKALYDNSYLLNGEDTSIKYVFNYKNLDNEKFISYYKYVLDMFKDELVVLDLYENCLTLKDDLLVVIVDSDILKDKFLKVSDEFNKIYKSLGYNTKIEVITLIKESVLEEIEKEIEEEIKNISKIIPKEKVEPKKTSKGTKTNPNIIIGRDIKDSPLKIKTILGEDDNITVEALLFGIDFFESAKTNFKIITMKITDYTDSMYCKVFVKDKEEYDNLKKQLKVGGWFLIKGYTKNDSYAKEIVLNARSIIKVEKEVTQVEDTADEKRVELHAHTKMSQMDGISDDVALVKQAIKWGHKGIAITDHNSVQAYPHVYNFITGYNKGKSDEEKFRVIFGTELTLIDDAINIVVRSNNLKLLEQTYVVFDFETTGFNAGGEDSIIEIGAAMIKNGEIIDTFSQLVNPKKKLSNKIIEITKITDDMLKDEIYEEEAVRNFIEWFKDYPMVAHNAKFDISFLEMAYQKYNLGTFTNPVIDTLELSRTLDSNFARHSLSTLVKRYDIPWDENAHHRADYDAIATAQIFHKMMVKLDNRNISNMNEINEMVSTDEIHKYGSSFHVNILVKNLTGLKNLFKILSFANTKYLYKNPRILRSELEKHRDGLLIGSGCYLGEVFVQAKSKSEDELSNIIRFYDYVEVQPLECYDHLLQDSSFANIKELGANIEKIIRVTKEAGKLIVATGDVHHITKEEKIYREIIVNQKVPGGGMHPLSRKSITSIPSNHLRTTNEMIDNFSFLNDEKLVEEIVIANPNKILDMMEDYEVIRDTKGIPFSPNIKDSSMIVTNMVFDKARELYGNEIPYIILERISKELYGDTVLNAIKNIALNENKSDDEMFVFTTLEKEILKGKENIIKLVKNDLRTDSVSEEELDKMTNKALAGIIGGNYDVIYLISQKLVKKSNDDGYLVGSRGSVGSSFIATLMGITEVNPLIAHYLCLNDKCKYSEFIDPNTNKFYSVTYSSGYDLKDKVCPKCGEKLFKEGQDMPFATFLGFNGDKVPDIDLNFSGDNQNSAHQYTKVLFGEDNVYRAGTIGTVAEKTAFGYVKGYFEDKEIENVRTAEVERLAMGCTGVKRTTGQHPGGIVVIPEYMDIFDFTPFQLPADNIDADWRTTHFDYHSLEDNLLKLDILGHDDPTMLRMLQDLTGIEVTKLPMDDAKIYSLLSSPDELGVTEDDIMCPTGTLGLPELGTRFVINMLTETKPKNFSELVKISGLSHGTDVWEGNASLLIEKNIVPFKDVIGCRDDIMVNLMNWGLEPIKAFKIMEFVRKGKASKDPDTWKTFEEIMKQAKIPDWYIESCFKIKYMFPKAHAVAYVMSAIRIAWFKLYKPIYYYAAFFSIRVDDFDIETMIKGKASIKAKIEDLMAKGYEITNKESNVLDSLKIALEATSRGITFAPIDLDKSDSYKFIIEDSSLIPPFKTIDGLGGTVAEKIIEEREKQDFISKEDLSKRGKVSKTLIEKMTLMGIISDLPESNQLSLF